jgi:hypothetical protein
VIIRVVQSKGGKDRHVMLPAEILGLLRQRWKAPPTDIVVMDNLPAHKGARVEQLIIPQGRNCDICRPTART